MLGIIPVRRAAVHLTYSFIYMIILKARMGKINLKIREEVDDMASRNDWVVVY